MAKIGFSVCLELGLHCFFLARNSSKSIVPCLHTCSWLIFDPFSLYMTEEDFLLPNVLLGDLFVLAMNRTPEEIAAEERALLDQLQPVGEFLDSSGAPPPLKPRSLPQMGLSKKSSPPVPSQPSKETMRLFTCNTYPVGTFPNWGGSLIPVSCDACGIPIRRSSHYMRCSDCVKPMVDLCVMCFANGAEFGDHKRSHGYSVVKNRLGNRKLAKLDVFDFLNFLSVSAEKGSLNFSEFEKSVLHYADNAENGINASGLVVSNGGGVSRSNGYGRRFGGRGVRTTLPDSLASSEPPPAAAANRTIPNVKQTTDAEKIYLSVINMLTGCREELSVEDLVANVSEAPPISIVPGPANYNTLREEFEFEFLPEAETILAAVSPPGKAVVPQELVNLMEGYNGILDERERRKRTLVTAGLTSVKEFTTTASQKKRKTDEKEAFEKSRIFLRAVSESLDAPGGKGAATKKPTNQPSQDHHQSCSASVKFLDQLASHITTRKRLIDRLKRLSSLWKHGLVAEDQSALQFDTDKKKRNDLNSVKSKTTSPPNTNNKIWTFLPNQTDIGGTIARTNRGHLVSDDGTVNAIGQKISPIDIFLSLPGGTELSGNTAAVQLCLEYYIAPQHFLVVESAIHAMMRSQQRGSDSKMQQLIRDGIFGTTKRYIQGGGGPQSSSLPYTVDEMRNSLIKCCRDSFRVAIDR